MFACTHSFVRACVRACCTLVVVLDRLIRCKTFVVEKSEFGVLSHDELRPGGAAEEVTKDNVTEYIELLVEYYLFHSVRTCVRTCARLCGA